MSSAAAGTWNLVGTENFDEYMKAIGVGLMTRKIGGQLKPTQEITVSGDEWHIKTISSFKTVETKFNLDKEYDETTADGRKVKTTATFDNDELTLVQRGSPDSIIMRKFSGDDMLMTLTAKLPDKDVVCTRKYSRATS